MFNLGLIGLGGIMHGAHIPGIKRCPDLAVHAICDIKPDALARTGDELGIPEERRFADYRDLLACPGVDAVDIATPNDVHAKIAMAAIKAGKPVSCEKPLAMNAADAQALAYAAAVAKLPNMVCFSYRYRYAARLAREMIRRGDIGEIHHVAIQYMQHWGLAECNCSLVWRFVKEKTGSGALGDLGSHAADLVRFVTGCDYRRVVGHCGTIIHERPVANDPNVKGPVDVDDYANYMAELSNGASCCFQITRFAYGRGNYQRMEIYGSKGALVYKLDDNGSGRDTLEACVGPVYNRTGRYTELPIPDYRIHQMQSFANELKGIGSSV